MGGVQDVRSRLSTVSEHLGVEFSGMARTMLEAMMMLESRRRIVGCARGRASSPVMARGHAVEHGDGEKHGHRRSASADLRNRTSRSVVAAPWEAGGAHHASKLWAVKPTSGRVSAQPRTIAGSRSGKLPWGGDAGPWRRGPSCWCRVGSPMRDHPSSGSLGRVSRSSPWVVWQWVWVMARRRRRGGGRWGGAVVLHRWWSLDGVRTPYDVW